VRSVFCNAQHRAYRYVKKYVQHNSK